MMIVSLNTFMAHSFMGKHITEIKYDGEYIKLSINITAETNRTFKIPLTGVKPSSATVSYSVAYNWVVDWGDGTIETKTGVSSSTAFISHIYASYGKYSVKITPVVNDYSWARAIRDNGNFPEYEKAITSIDYMTTKGFVWTKTEVGHYFLGLNFLRKIILFKKCKYC